MNKVFIFDLDDTLYWNMYDYCYALIEFQKFILDNLRHNAPHVLTLLKLAREIRKRKPGYSKDTFPSVLVETYRTICISKNIQFNLEFADKIWQIGMEVFDPKLYRKKGLVEGAEEVLNFLKAQKDVLVLVTRGDRYVQGLKIDALGLNKWFRYNAFIVPQKDEAIFRKIKMEHNGMKIYSIGNSLKSDIEPALEAGLLGIYIPYDTWEYEENVEEILNKINKSRLFVFKEIIEIKNRYKEL